MRPDDRIRLLHMIEAAETVGAFVAGRHRADLDADRMLLFARVRAIEIIGEAASRVSPSTRATAPVVPWVQMTGMRNRLIHSYFDIDHDVLWQTAAEEIPSLLPLLQALVSQTDPSA
jgi:uncharacterized protein with HEPN domain